MGFGQLQVDACGADRPELVLDRPGFQKNGSPGRWGRVGGIPTGSKRRVAPDRSPALLAGEVQQAVVVLEAAVQRVGNVVTTHPEVGCQLAQHRIEQQAGHGASTPGYASGAENPRSGRPGTTTVAGVASACSTIFPWATGSTR